MSNSTPDDVRSAPAPRLAGMIGTDTPAGADWTPGELAQILHTYLNSPAGGATAGGAGPTWEQLLGDPTPPVEQLARLCEQATAARRDAEGAVPAEVATVLYYAASAAA